MRALVRHVGAVAERRGPRRPARRSCFSTGMRFAGECRLLDLAAALPRACAGRPGPRCRPRAGRCRPARVVAPASTIAVPSRTTRACSAASCFSAAQRLLGAILLHEADHRVEHDDGENGDGVLDLADEAGDDRRGDQQHDHEIGELAEAAFAMGCARLLADLVRPVDAEALRGFRSGQPAVDGTAQLFRRLRCGDDVPRRGADSGRRCVARGPGHRRGFHGVACTARMPPHAGGFAAALPHAGAEFAPRGGSAALIGTPRKDPCRCHP